MKTINLYCSWKRETVNELPAYLETFLITNTGNRYFLSFRCWDRTYYRTTNKRTGAPLKKAVVDHVTENALLVDTCIYNPEASEAWYDWEETKKYYCYVNDGSKRDLSIEKVPRAEDLVYNRENILYIINKITGGSYDNINIVYGETIKPAEWETIQARETAAARWEAIEAEIDKISGFIDAYLQRGKNISALTLEKMRALESYTGTTAADVDRIKNLVKRGGGWYEKNIMSSSARLILKESADCFKVYNLAQNTFFRVKNNIITA